MKKNKTRYARWVQERKVHFFRQLCTRIPACIFVVSLGLLSINSCAYAAQQPINMLFDMHVDPIPSALPLQIKHDIYLNRIANMNWVMDQTEPFGVKISFLSGGWWCEFVVDEAGTGVGSECLQRLYDNGGQIGSHSHEEYHADAFTWQFLSNLNPPINIARSAWADTVIMVDQAIQSILGQLSFEELRDINAVRGTHVPSDADNFYQLMENFEFQIRQGGPEEDYYGYYGHHIWNPYRPSMTNDMVEDLQGPFVTPTQGSVIGKQEEHHNVYQDMSSGSVKRQFLQLYINWRYQLRTGQPENEKVWTWGWGSHASDFAEGSESSYALVNVLQWLDEHFAQRELNGQPVMIWATQTEAAQSYFDWETTHPNTSSFSFDESQGTDWEQYPYLIPVAMFMRDYRWEDDLTLGDNVDAYLLAKDGEQAIVLWSEDVISHHVDVSSFLGDEITIIGLETGNNYTTQYSAENITVRQEPLFVKQR